MAGYMPAQTLLKTLIATVASFTAGDVVEGDLRVLDQGRTNMAILFPGALPAYDTAGFGHEHNWECFVDLFTRYTDETSYNDFGTLRDAVIAKINAVPTLSTAYFVMSITGEGDPGEVYDKLGGGPYFITQRLRVAIQENV